MATPQTNPAVRNQSAAAAPSIAAAKTAPRPGFGRINYLLMLGSIGLIMLGFIVMTMETAQYGFGFLGLTLGPVLVFSGFVVAGASILVKDKGETA